MICYNTLMTFEEYKAAIKEKATKEETPKTDRYIVYHQWSKDEEFRGTRAECEAWVAEFNLPKFAKTFFISHESK